jgi:hypothetical protein
MVPTKLSIASAIELASVVTAVNISRDRLGPPSW